MKSLSPSQHHPPEEAKNPETARTRAHLEHEEVSRLDQDAVRLEAPVVRFGRHHAPVQPVLAAVLLLGHALPSGAPRRHNVPREVQLVACRVDEHQRHVPRARAVRLGHACVRVVVQQLAQRPAQLHMPGCRERGVLCGGRGEEGGVERDKNSSVRWEGAQARQQRLLPPSSARRNFVKRRL